MSKILNGHHFDYRNVHASILWRGKKSTEYIEKRIAEIKEEIDVNIRIGLQNLSSHYVVGKDYMIDYSDALPKSPWSKGSTK